MPITRDEFNKGRTRNTVKEQIEILLENNKDKAYTFQEISDYVFGKAKNFGEAILKVIANSLILENALYELIKEGKIEAKDVKTPYGKEVYYAWKLKNT